MKFFNILLFLLSTTSVFSQQIRFVNADNGLIIRESTNKKSKQIGKLEYGTEVEVIEETEIELKVKDGQKNITGKWVKVQEIDGNQKGYVFNGYLTPNQLHKKIEIKFKDFSVQMELDVWDENGDLKKTHNGNAKIYVELGDTPEGKKVKIKQSKFKKIEVFQRHENSVTIMNEGPHCDLTKWKHYYSEWKKLDFDAEENSFISDSYEREDREKFIEVGINELKKEVEKECGKHWSEQIKNIKNVNEYPSRVSTSRIFFKILLIDRNDSVTEKIISFEIPMGC